MNAEGLDALDDRILDILEVNARATYSEIGEKVGLSRVAVKNRIEAMEKCGVIQGYKTIIRTASASWGIHFVVDVEATPELYQEVVDTLGKDRFLRQIYTTSGECRLHAIGFALNVKTLEAHVNQLFLNTKGIRKLSWHLLLNTIKDVDGGVEYVG